jgi:hypothetical protein
MVNKSSIKPKISSTLTPIHVTIRMTCFEVILSYSMVASENFIEWKKVNYKRTKSVLFILQDSDLSSWKAQAAH